MMKYLSQTLFPGILFAAAGFSYALATSAPDAGAATNSFASASGRAAGSNFRLPLHFTTPLVPNSTDHDLGDAAFGSAFTRWVRAKGGVPPHRFTADRGNTEFKGTVSLQDAISGLPSTVAPDPTSADLLLNGRFQGTIGKLGGSLGTNSTPVDFDVTVTDSRGVNPNVLTERFRLTMVDPNTFKIGRTVLNDAVEFRGYFDRIEAVAGTSPLTYGTSQITLTNDTGVHALTSLTDDMGLFFNTKNGAITGRPLQAGLLQFLVTCTDKNGVQALSRDKSSIGQIVSINVLPNPRITSELFSTGISISGDTSGGTKDSIKYAGLVALSDNIASLANSNVTLQIGNYTSPTVTLDANGKGSTGKVTPSMSVSVSATGQLKISIANESFAKSGSILSDITKTVSDQPVTVTIGNQFLASELLRFGVKARGTQFKMNYKFGPGNLGGGFFLTSVQGKDGTGGDAWKAQFMFLPPKDQKFDAASTATIGIGTDFTDTIKLINGNGNIGTGEKRDPKAPLVTKISLSKTGKGSVTTGVLPTTSATPNQATSLPTAATGPKHTRFAFIIDFNDVNGKQLFGAEGGSTIFTDGKATWQTKSRK